MRFHQEQRWCDDLSFHRHSDGLTTSQPQSSLQQVVQHWQVISGWVPRQSEMKSWICFHTTNLPSPPLGCCDEKNSHNPMMKVRQNESGEYKAHVAPRIFELLLLLFGNNSSLRMKLNWDTLISIFLIQSLDSQNSLG